MKADELRRRYLEFFQKKGHQLFSSDSLVPEGDASVLFTGAGMNQFKDAFLGKGPKGLTRATSSQKCLRMPDLDNVGRTPSHHTFFEMLGNFSFGDYFKREAIGWAIEFLEQDLGLARDQLAISVYEEDDEAAEIWEKEIGFARNRIWRYGEKDNFWPAEAPSKGPNGPCGPCSEIYFDFGEKATRKRGVESDPAGDGDRFVEIWNLVFTQFERKGVNDLVPLPRKNIDTGMGLERVVRVLQGKPNNFETDLFVPILDAIGGQCGRRYGAETDVDMRMKRIADHVRAATFCISDGVRPSNQSRGYVVRKIIRRASMDMKELGEARAALNELVPTIVGIMGDAYPELREHESVIRDTIRHEEESFGERYREGREQLQVYLDDLDDADDKKLSGERAFFLWDTRGLSFDITRRLCEDQGFSVDEDAFQRLLDGQRQRSKDGSQIADDIFDTGPASRLKGQVEPTLFTGYDGTKGEAEIVAILGADGERTEAAEAGDTEVMVVLDRTPLYAESGGQVGDTGKLTAEGVVARILDTKKAEGFHLHRVRVVDGPLRVGDRVQVEVDRGRRGDIVRNHTATHLLHWALRRVLGPSTTQAGSLVHPDYLRFDYTADEAPTPEQLREIEDLINGQVIKDLGVAKNERSYDEAKADGAMALFGEKYGDRVRVVHVVEEEVERDQHSVELCGGTHVGRTGEIGVVKITSDSAIAAGVRRIVALTGTGALRAIQEKYSLAHELSQLLKAPEPEMAERVENLLKERSRLEKEVAKAKRAAAAESFDDILADGADLGDGGRLFVHVTEGVGPEELRTLADRLLKEAPDGVAILAGTESGKVALVVASGPQAVGRGVKAGDLCRQLGQALGGGGGRPQLAQGQGQDATKLPEALREIEAKVREQWGRAAPA